MNFGNIPLVSNILSAPALRFRDFRFLWISSVFNAVGFQGEQVVLGWLVLELTDSPVLVGTALALRMAPFLLIGLPAGAIADRVNRRDLLFKLTFGMSALTFVLFALTLLGFLSIWNLLLITFLGGVLRAMHQPTRQSFAYDIVGQANLISGLSFLSLSMRIGGIVGSLTTGLLVGYVGYHAAYAFLAISYICSVIAILAITKVAIQRVEPSQGILDNLRELIAEIRRNSPFRTLLLLSAGVEILGFSHQAILPVLARDVLSIGAEGLGVMMALRSIGGILAILALSAVTEIKRQGLLYLVVLHVFAASLFLLAYADTLYLAMIAILLINGMGALSDILSQSLIQTTVPDGMRGRAMGSWVVAVGWGPIGHLQIGALASGFGVSIALFTHGFGLLVLAVAAITIVPKLRNM